MCLCGNLTHLYMHIKSAETSNNHDNTCKVCGKLSYSRCSICGVYMNLISKRVQAAGRTCFFDCHNDTFFGFSCADSGLSKNKCKDWTCPSHAKKIENSSIINKLNDGSS